MSQLLSLLTNNVIKEVDLASISVAEWLVSIISGFLKQTIR